MSKIKSPRVLASVSVAAAATAGAMAFMAPVDAATAPPKQPPSSVGIGSNTAVPANVLNFGFVNQANKPTTLGSFKGKTVFITPFLTLCPDTCPFTSGNVIQLNKAITAAKANKTIQLVLVDVDPYRDSPARLAAYAKIIGSSASNISYLTLRQPASAPISAANAYPALATVFSFFGMQAQKVATDTPPSIDWWTHKKLTYDISHSDGFFVINAKGSLRFVSGNPPQFRGKLAPSISTFLNDNGVYTLHHPTAGGWTPAEAIQAISWVRGAKV